MTYVEAMINNSNAKMRAKSMCKKERLRKEIYNKTGWMPSKNLSMRLMKEASGINNEQ